MGNRKAKRIKYIIGIDEVGRGSLAGPVAVAAVAAPINLKTKNLEFKTNLQDSKKLTQKQRLAWFIWIKKHSNILKDVGMFFATARVSPRVIDRINISRAANLAATRALIKLIERSKNYKIKKLRNRRASKNNRKKSFNLSIFQSCNIYLDGGLYLNKISVNQRRSPRLSASTIIKGDEKIPAIMLASIIAKVTRDRYMKKLHKKYPKYDFIHNVGYGTKKHIKAIKKIGYSAVHRRSFKIK